MSNNPSLGAVGRELIGMLMEHAFNHQEDEKGTMEIIVKLQFAMPLLDDNVPLTEIWPPNDDPARDEFVRNVAERIRSGINDISEGTEHLG